jgi:hypothetical protein
MKVDTRLSIAAIVTDQDYLSKRGPFNKSMHFNLIIHLFEVDSFDIHRWIISSKGS